VLPLVALGMAFHGVYLLTSIGLNLTSRTEFYPIATFIAAGVGLVSGLALMPVYGAFGAAIAFLLSYATLAGVAFLFARRLYPIGYEVSRLIRIVLAAIAAVMVSRWVPAMPAAWSLIAHGLVTVTVYGALLAASGFLRASERAFLAEAVSRARLKRRPVAEGEQS
jgi:O-antigen/teichoic acid export membrane protein